MKPQRKYLPTLSELIDRLSIAQLKEVFITKHKEEYSQEIKDILHDIQICLDINEDTINAEIIRAIVVLSQMNLHIWHNESNYRKGIKNGNNLELTHGLNGIRNTAKNKIQEIAGGRKDYKIDCLAAEFKDWEISWSDFIKDKANPIVLLEDSAKIIQRHKDIMINAGKEKLVDVLREDLSKYDEQILNFGWGERKSLRHKDYKDYMLIQRSRCGSVSFDNKTSIKQELENAQKESLIFNTSDKERIKEINLLIKDEYIDLPENPTFFELGFRSIKLLQYYDKMMGMKTHGCDVIDSNIAVAECLGYNTLLYNFDNCEEELDLKNADLVVSYHMLEHVTDPYIAIQKIYESMKPGSYFHVEVPVEGFDGPQIRYSHMYSFYPDDLSMMLYHTGFKLLAYKKLGGAKYSFVERWICQK